ncbi:esterase/lipase [Catenulispora acidiphila DSM 44928]|uniref:Esterase/lipase n=1 Tax=Catenulispora acidiphila (strain DSM 44928 / JCM 14897 / NBRC 102108 / NRRL B-24433 / ID139908) TaxID=479433 RepID=C7QGN7_CATAD|nr:alpha/beta fold hydrolase [Catenulispora acidiphila]ACU74917.1 esterase/lipase [Catenulispora acidiphila DSM 44928]
MTAPVLPGAEPFSHDVPAAAEAAEGAGPARIGVLLCHGFTGSPQSLRPWAEHLAEAGFGVRLPRLPGHGTDWHDMQVTTWDDWYAEVDRAFHELQAGYDRVFVMGLSMGGTLTLRLAERHGADVAGIVLVNASVKPDKAVIKLVPVLKLLVPSVAGIGNAINKQGVSELAYSRVPLKALDSFAGGWRTVAADLPKVTQPTLLFRSTADPVVHPSNSAMILSRISATDVTEQVLEKSSHVATLDHDAEQIYAGSVEFVRRVAGLGN